MLQAHSIIDEVVGPGFQVPQPAAHRGEAGDTRGGASSDLLRSRPNPEGERLRGGDADPEGHRYRREGRRRAPARSSVSEACVNPATTLPCKCSRVSRRGCRPLLEGREAPEISTMGASASAARRLPPLAPQQLVEIQRGSEAGHVTSRRTALRSPPGGATSASR